MSRGTVLSTIRAYLKAEIRDAQQTNSVADTEYNYALANKQKDLALAYDWPFLEHRWDLSFVAGTRFANLPTADIRALTCGINFERPVRVDRFYNSKYEEIDYGIGTEEYNYQNSDLGERIDPIQRWQLITNTSEGSNPDQVEVWPIPNTAQTLRFTGQRNVLALSSDSDKADLDDLLLVYFVAADYLLMRNQPNAPLAIRKAQEHLVRLRSAYPSRQCPPYNLGKPRYLDRRDVRLIPVVAVA